MLKNTLLWKISGQDPAQAPSYVFGTMHVRDKRAFKNWDKLTQCIDNCAQFAAEYDLAETEGLGSEFLQVPKGWKGLSQHLSPSVYAKLKKQMDKNNWANIEDCEHSHPILLLGLISGAEFSNESAQTLDAALYEYARSQSKKMLGLETLQSQIKLFSALPFKSAVRSLKVAATHHNRLRRQIRKSADAYLNQDLSALLKSVKQSTGDMRDLLLYRRNKIMVERIVGLMQAGSVFVAVGAGHLAGGKGILRGLKKAGYQVEGVAFNISD
jgi:uncharacterized protein